MFHFFTIILCPIFPNLHFQRRHGFRGWFSSCPVAKNSCKVTRRRIPVQFIVELPVLRYWLWQCFTSVFERQTCPIIRNCATIGLGVVQPIGKALAEGGPWICSWRSWSGQFYPVYYHVYGWNGDIFTHYFLCEIEAGVVTKTEITHRLNFWFLCCAQIPFEAVTVNSIIHFWRDGLPVALR